MQMPFCAIMRSWTLLDAFGGSYAPDNIYKYNLRIIKRMKDSESVYGLEEKTKCYYLCSVRVCSYLCREKGQGILIIISIRIYKIMQFSQHSYFI